MNGEVYMRRLIAAAALLISGVPLAAHHSISGAYKTEERIKIEGTVVAFSFRDPHSFLELSGPDPKTGAPVNFNLEWGSVLRLERDHISKETLKSGDHLVVLANPSRKSSDPTLHLVGVRRKSDGWTWGRRVE
jgi:hypothetical protein